MTKTLDSDTVNAIFRERVLAALDEAAAATFEAAGYTMPDNGKGATDADLPVLFAAIEAQVDRLADRIGELTVVETFDKVDMKLHPFDGYHASAGAGVNFGYQVTLPDLRQEIRDHFDEEEREVPLDSPSLDTSFHDHEMNVD